MRFHFIIGLMGQTIFLGEGIEAARRRTNWAANPMNSPRVRLAENTARDYLIVTRFDGVHDERIHGSRFGLWSTTAYSHSGVGAASRPVAELRAASASDAMANHRAMVATVNGGRIPETTPPIRELGPPPDYLSTARGQQVVGNRDGSRNMSSILREVVIPQPSAAGFDVDLIGTPIAPQGIAPPPEDHDGYGDDDYNDDYGDPETRTADRS